MPQDGWPVSTRENQSGLLHLYETRVILWYFFVKSVNESGPTLSVGPLSFSNKSIVGV